MAKPLQSFPDDITFVLRSIPPIMAVYCTISRDELETTSADILALRYGRNLFGAIKSNFIQREPVAETP